MSNYRMMNDFPKVKRKNKFLAEMDRLCTRPVDPIHSLVSDWTRQLGNSRPHQQPINKNGFRTRHLMNGGPSEEAVMNTP